MKKTIKLLLLSVLTTFQIAQANNCSLYFENYSNLPHRSKKALKKLGYLPTDFENATHRAKMFGGCLQNPINKKIDNCGFEIYLNDESYQSSGDSWNSTILGVINKLPECNNN